MSCIIRLVGIAGREHQQFAPQWITSYDVDADDGYGEVRTTRDREEAQRFPTMSEAIQAWRTQSTVRPLRGDGKPNRPLTAYTVEIEPYGDE